nr:ABC transporter ATP-binding protein [uncultured Sphingomonas sp.]
MTSVLSAEVALPPRLHATQVSIAAGERVALIGPNGSGKTTLLRALAGIDGDSSRTFIGGEALGDMSAARRLELLAFLPASREMRWPIPVRDMVALGLVQPDAGHVDQLLDRLQLSDLADRPIDLLSTGERARALLGRALASRPRLLLLDEPLSNLDPAWVLRILDLLDEVARDGCGLLTSLHVLSLLERFDRVLMMDNGRLAADMPPRDLLASRIFADTFEVEPDGPGWALRPSAGPQSLR